MTREEELNNIKYWVCCPLCDNKQCVKGTKDCEAEQWLKLKKATIIEADKEKYDSKE